jgi:peptide/nickel transport system permease protein
MAIALAGRPKLLIADEPTTALDVTVQAEILALLRRLQEETGMAILLITHNWGVIADLCDRVVVMYAGQVVEVAGSQEMFDEPLNPYTLGLLQSHPALVEHGKSLAATPGSVPAPGAWPAHCRFADRCRFAADECFSDSVPLALAGGDRLSRCIRIDALRSRVKA